MSGPLRKEEIREIMERNGVPVIEEHVERLYGRATTDAEVIGWCQGYRAGSSLGYEAGVEDASQGKADRFGGE